MFDTSSCDLTLQYLPEPSLVTFAVDDAQMTNIQTERMHHIGELFWVSEIILLFLAGVNKHFYFFCYEGLDLEGAGLALSVAEGVILEWGILDQFRS